MSRLSMPPARKPKRCQAREDGRRCYRNGSGQPPLCRTHKLALSQGLDPNDPFRDVFDQVDRWVKSREGRDTVVAAVGTLADRLLDRFAPQRRSPLGPVPRPPRMPPPPPPPERPKADPVQVARALLHFGPDEPLTREKIKERQRVVATLCHPDRGGSTEAMQWVNQAADILCNTLT